MEWYQKLGIEITSEKLTTLTNAALQAERKAVVQGLRNLLDAADAESRDISAKEEATYKAAEQYLSRVESEIGRRPANSPPPMSFTSGENSQAIKPIRGGVGMTYRSLFYGNEKATIADTRDIEQFFVDVTEKRAMVDGGAFVPESFVALTLDATLQLQGLFSKCRLLPVDKGSTLTVGAFDNADRSNNQHFGGVSVMWRGESEAFTAVDPETRQINYTLKKMGMFINCSRELLEGFGGNFAAVLAEKMSFALAAEGEQMILRGDGVGRPQGIIGAPCTIGVARSTANSVGYADLAGMVGRLHPALFNGSCWVCNQEVMPQLLQLVDPLGGYVWVPNAAAGADAKIPGRLFGLPLIVSEFCSALGSEGDICLGNFSVYGVAVKKDVSFEATNAARWLNDEWSYRSIWRIDSKPLLHETIQPQNGTDTVSAFVVLD